MTQESSHVRCFTEANEGKDEGDANAGLIKRMLKKCIDEGEDAEDELDYFNLISNLRVPGQNVSMLRLNREEEQPNPPGRTPVENISHYAMWTVDTGDEPESGTITFYESLDVKRATQEGVITGYGEGYTMNISDFNALHRTLPPPQHTPFLHKGGHSSDEVHTNGKLSQEQKRQREDDLATKRRMKQERRAPVDCADTEYLEGGDQGPEIFRCSHCTCRFITSRGFAAHRGGCPKLGRKPSTVRNLLKSFEEVWVESERQRVQDLDKCKVSFRFKSSFNSHFHCFRRYLWKASLLPILGCSWSGLVDVSWCVVWSEEVWHTGKPGWVKDSFSVNSQLVNISLS